MKSLVSAALAGALLLAPVPARAEVAEVVIPKGAGGLIFLPFLVMEKHQLIEKHARVAGLERLAVQWINVGGPGAVNEALLSGSAHFIAAGPPSFLTLWSRTQTSIKVKGIAALSSIPLYLNTRATHLNKLEDLNDRDKVAVTAVKVSLTSIVMQMYALEKYGVSEAYRFDRYTVGMSHPDGVVAMLSRNPDITAHFTSPPFHQQERKDPTIRTIMSTNDMLRGSSTSAMVSATTKFRDENPKVYASFFKALQEAVDLINADKSEAAKVYLATPGNAGFSVEEIVAILSDPDIKYTTTPEKVMKYAEFMFQVGSIKVKPASWQEMFFPEIASAPGS
jgi:NitT/TauT family transport system substrate-binding protein